MGATKRKAVSCRTLRNREGSIRHSVPASKRSSFSVRGKNKTLGSIGKRDSISSTASSVIYSEKSQQQSRYVSSWDKAKMQHFENSSYFSESVPPQSALNSRNKMRQPVARNHSNSLSKCEVHFLRMTNDVLPKPRSDLVITSSYTHQNKPLKLSDSPQSSSSKSNIPIKLSPLENKKARAKGRRSLTQNTIHKEVNIRKNGHTIIEGVHTGKSLYNHSGTKVTTPPYNDGKGAQSVYKSNFVLPQTLDKTIHSSRRQRSPKVDLLHKDANEMKEIALMKAKASQWRESCELLQNVVKLHKAMKHFGSPHYSTLDVADTYYHLGVSLNWLHKPDLALDALNKSLDLRRKELGDEHLDVASVLSYIGMIKGNEGDYEGAIHNLGLASLIQRRNQGHDDTTTSRLLNDFLHARDSLGCRALAA